MACAPAATSLFEDLAAERKLLRPYAPSSKYQLSRLKPRAPPQGKCALAEFIQARVLEHSPRPYRRASARRNSCLRK